MLNMIVGVVVENFERSRERLEDEEKQSTQRKLLEKAKNKNDEGTYSPIHSFVYPSVCSFALYKRPFIDCGFFTLPLPFNSSFSSFISFVV